VRVPAVPLTEVSRDYIDLRARFVGSRPSDQSGRPARDHLSTLADGPVCCRAGPRLATHRAGNMELRANITFSDVATAVVPGSAPMLTDRGRAVYSRRPAGPQASGKLSDSERVILAQIDPKLIVRTEPASDACNCFGWIFAGGRCWFTLADVELIIADNGYRTVADPRPNDLAIYKQDGQVSHAAIVRTVEPGGPVIVEGKWGFVGVFRHAAQHCPYGQSFTFHRSRRVRHELRQFRDGQAE
jgi:hypothetical protein